MNKQEKVKFVKDLIKGIQAKMIEDIHLSKIPEEWDGIELRQLLSDRVADNVTPMNATRKKWYIHSVVKRNL